MSDPTGLEEAVADAHEAFTRAQGTVETGLEDADAAAGQLQKACRLLAAARTLRAQNGYYTALVELAFGAIERSFEFYALALSNDEVRDFHDHAHAYQRAFELGVLSRELKDDYRALYTENRSESYYGDRGATDQQASAMFALAVETHEFLRDHPRDHYDCLCPSPE